MNRTSTRQFSIGPAFRNSLNQAIRDAQNTIRVMCYHMAAPTPASHINYRELWTSILEAPSRGVDCRAILSADLMLNARGDGNQQAAATMIRAGWKVQFAPPRPTMHVKAWCFDDLIIACGSHNITQAAMLTNREISTIWADTEMTAEYTRLFSSIWKPETQNGTT